MAKQIIISSGDYGIVFELQIFDNKGIAVPILNDKVVVNIVYPDGTKRVIDTTNEVTVTDSANGIVEFALKAVDTTQLGNYSIYIELENASYDISTTSATNYFVVAKNGGAV